MSTYQFLYPLIKIEFRGNIAYLREPLDDSYSVKIGKRGHEKYLTVNAKATPRHKILNKKVDESDAFQAITAYIAKHIGQSYVRIKNKGFINRIEPITATKIRVLKAECELKIFSGIRTEYYFLEASKDSWLLMVSIMPVFDLEISPTLSNIIRTNFRKGVLKDVILAELRNIELSTVENYWRNGLGPKGAGTLEDFYLPGEYDHRSRLANIRKYYEKKGKWRKILELLPKPENDIIVTVERYTRGEKTYPDYLGGLLVLTPSLQTLSNLVDDRTLSRVHDVMRPRPRKFGGYRDYQDFYEKVREAVEDYLEAIRSLELVEVKNNAILG